MCMTGPELLRAKIYYVEITLRFAIFTLKMLGFCALVQMLILLQCRVLYCCALMLYNRSLYYNYDQLSDATVVPFRCT